MSEIDYERTLVSSGIYTKKVCAVRPDGEMAGWFDSVTDAAKVAGVVADSIYTALTSWKRNGTRRVTKGLQWYYLKDYLTIKASDPESLKFAYNDRFDPMTGKFTKGHAGFNKKYNCTEEDRRKRGERILKARESGRAKQIESAKKPVMCLNDGKYYPSHNDCMAAYGITRKGVIGRAIRYGWTVNGQYRFVSVTKEEYEENTRTI